MSASAMDNVASAAAMRLSRLLAVSSCWLIAMVVIRFWLRKSCTCPDKVGLGRAAACNACALSTSRPRITTAISGLACIAKAVASLNVRFFRVILSSAIASLQFKTVLNKTNNTNCVVRMPFS